MTANVMCAGILTFLIGAFGFVIGSRIRSYPLYWLSALALHGGVGLSWFFVNNIFFYCMFTISAFTQLYLCAFPNDRRALDDD